MYSIRHPEVLVGPQPVSPIHDVRLAQHGDMDGVQLYTLSEEQDQ